MKSQFIDRLLSRTADWHTRLGQNILLINLMSEKVTLEDHIKYLSALYGFISGFERYIFPEVEAFVPDLEQRKKTKIIEKDLALLGVKTVEFDELSASYFRSMYHDPYAALGALYVMESSALGGHIIKDHLKQTLDGNIIGKLRYFLSHRRTDEKLWRSFLEQFVSIADNSDKEENIIDGALRTYRLLDRLMTDESVKKAALTYS